MYNLILEAFLSLFKKEFVSRLGLYIGSEVDEVQ